MKTGRPPYSLSEILSRQDNVVDRRQLLAAGYTDIAISRKVRSGEWQRLLPGVYRTVAERPSLETRRVAAALFAGKEAQLTGAATLLRYGFTSPLAGDRIHVLIPHRIRCRSTGFAVVQRTRDLDPHPRDAGLYRMTSPARAVVDACRTVGELQHVRATMAEAVQRNLVSLDDLDREIRRAGRSRTALARRAWREIVAGTRSAPEAELRDIVERSRLLPEVFWNPVLVGPNGNRLPTPDGWIDDVSLALEVDSTEHHAEGEGWRRTLDRGNDLTKLGAGVLHITPDEIRLSATAVRRKIEETYVNRKQLGMSAPITVARRAPS